MYRRAIICLILSLVLVSYSSARTYYVKPTGNDANSGLTEALAWQHIQKACLTLVAGDTVLIRAGTYAEYGAYGADCETEMPPGGCGTLTPKNSGTSSSNRIVYKGYPGERPIISGACGGTDYNCSAVNIGKSHIVLDSLIITKSWHGVYADGVTGLIIKNCKIIDNDGGVWDGNSGGIFLGYLLVMDNKRDGVLACTVSACSISNNKQYHLRQWNSSGIHVYGTKNSLFQNNIIFDQYNGIRFKHVDTSNVIKGNIIYDCNYGITLGNPIYNNQVYENIIHHTGWGIYANLDPVAYGPPWGSKRNKIYNNTIYAPTGGGIFLEDSWGASNNDHNDDTIYNNIVMEASSAELQIVEDNHPNLYNDYDCYYDAGVSNVISYHGSSHTLAWYIANTIYGDHSINVDPLFVDPPTSAYDASWDLHLQAGSPAKGTGRGGVDRGAYPSSSPDTTKPIITNVAATNITPTTATINWTTNERATSQVEYGLDATYGAITALIANLVTSHSQNLGGLTSNTTYHFRVRSKDGAGNESISQDNTFRTAPDSLSPPQPISPPDGSTIEDTSATLIIRDGRDSLSSTLMQFFQLDSAASFNSTELQQSSVLALSHFDDSTTAWTVPQPLRLGQYYWRAYAYTNSYPSDTSDPSQVFHFMFIPKSIPDDTSKNSGDSSHRVYVEPVAFKPSLGHTYLTFHNIPLNSTVRVYTIFGDLVKTFSDTQQSNIAWDVKNEHQRPLASDAYLYYIHNQGHLIASGKFVVIR